MNSIRNAVKSGTGKGASTQKAQDKDGPPKPKISPFSKNSKVVQEKSTDVAVGVPVVAKGEPALVANGVPASIGEDKPKPNSSSSDAVNDYILHLNAPKKGMFRGIKKFFSSLLGKRQHKKKKAFEALLEDYQRRHKQPISGNFGGAQQSMKQGCLIPEKPPKIFQDDDSAKGGLRRRKRASFIRLTKQKLRALRNRIRLARRGGGKDGASIKAYLGLTDGKRKINLQEITAQRLRLQKGIGNLDSILSSKGKDKKLSLDVQKKPGEHRPEHAVKLNPDKLVSLSDEAKTPGMYVAHNCDIGEVGIAFKDKTSDEVRFSSLKDSGHTDPMHMIYTGKKRGEGADAVEEKFSLMMPDENSPDKTACTLSGPGGLNIKIKLPQKDKDDDVFFDAEEELSPKDKKDLSVADNAKEKKLVTVPLQKDGDDGVFFDAVEALSPKDLGVAEPLPAEAKKNKGAPPPPPLIRKKKTPKNTTIPDYLRQKDSKDTTFVQEFESVFDNKLSSSLKGKVTMPRDLVQAVLSAVGQQEKENWILNDNVVERAKGLFGDGQLNENHMNNRYEHSKTKNPAIQKVPEMLYAIVVKKLEAQIQESPDNQEAQEKLKALQTDIGKESYIKGTQNSRKMFQYVEDNLSLLEGTEYQKDIPSLKNFQNNLLSQDSQFFINSYQQDSHDVLEQYLPKEEVKKLAEGVVLGHSSRVDSVKIWPDAQKKHCVVQDGKDVYILPWTAKEKALLIKLTEQNKDLATEGMDKDKFEKLCNNGYDLADMKDSKIIASKGIQSAASLQYKPERKSSWSSLLPKFIATGEGGMTMTEALKQKISQDLLKKPSSNPEGFANDINDILDTKS